MQKNDLKSPGADRLISYQVTRWDMHMYIG